MLRTFKATVTVGGYPMPAYTGTETVSINATPAVSREAISRTAERRIIARVAARMAINRCAIRVTDLVEVIESTTPR